MITIKRGLGQCFPFTFLVAVAACSSSASRQDAATGGPDGAKDVTCTGQACADLPGGAPDTNPASAADGPIDRADATPDLICTGPGCADSAFEAADARPADSGDGPLARADGNPPNPEDAPQARVDGDSPNPEDAPLARVDGNLPDARDAPLDRADDSRDSSPEDVVICSADAKPECVKGWVNYLDAGVCYEDMIPVEPECTNGGWRCYPGTSVLKSACSEKACETDRPTGACSAGDVFSCWGYPTASLYPNVHLSCTCDQGTWSCLY